MQHLIKEDEDEDDDDDATPDLKDGAHLKVFHDFHPSLSFATLNYVKW